MRVLAVAQALALFARPTIPPPSSSANPCNDVPRRIVCDCDGVSALVSWCTGCTYARGAGPCCGQDHDNVNNNVVQAVHILRSCGVLWASDNLAMELRRQLCRKSELYPNGSRR